MNSESKHTLSVALTYLVACVSFTFRAPITIADDSSTIRVLIVDGRNNHAWESTTNALKQILVQTGRFSVDISTAPMSYPAPRPRRPGNATEEEQKRYEAAMAAYQASSKKYEASIAKKWDAWRPKFADYDVVVDNYNGPDWMIPVKADFTRYVQQGGGLVVIHGANNAFSNWEEFNRMIGIGWRKAHQGIALTVDDESGKSIAEDIGKGINSGHGSKHPFVVKSRATNHPIMQGIPREWLHGRDELYHSMRGPAVGVQILATAFSSPKQRGTGKHEPVTWTTEFGRGRVVTNTMGHVWPSAGGSDGRNSLHCVGFQTVFARSCEWASGKPVTLDVPNSFPKPTQPSIIHPELMHWQAKGRTLANAPQSIVDAKQRTAWKKKQNPYALLTPEESIASMQLADGYEMELVVGEPHIREPVLAVWDGNGRLYIAEMRSYMQDEYGTGTKTLKNGRISRHEDTNGDGKLDRHTVFVDGLNLPRMILPLDDRIAVVETDSTAVVSYRDTSGDGKADEKTILYPGKRKIDSSRSVEHQDSGLVWAIDNWIYLSRGRERYRFTSGKWKVDPIEFDWNQWGLDQDDTGRLFFNDNSHPAKSFQQHPIYWTQIAKRAKGRWKKPTIGQDYEPDFLTMHSICQFGDRGESHAYRSFTSATGGSVFRGQGLGANANGNYFICDPTGHIVRRAEMKRIDGRIVLTNKYQRESQEFIASNDINFRPVHTSTGPDGALYLVDMYRGMIQDAPWVNEQMKQFLRRTGLNFNIHNGRVYRIKNKKSQLLPPPKLLDLPTKQLPHFLGSENGWVRDMAQRQIILREDQNSIVPTLIKMVNDNRNPLARLHALWTLEGCDAATAGILKSALKDNDWRVREAALRIGEPLLLEGNEVIWQSYEDVADDRDPNVARQLILSLGWSEDPRSVKLIDRVIKNHLTNEVVYLSAMTALYGRETPMIKKILSGQAFRTIEDPQDRINSQRRWTIGIANWKQKSTPTKLLSPADVKLVEDGFLIYAQLCTNCHGSDGLGVRMPNQPLKAPRLVGSPRVLGQKEVLVRILLHGLDGPVDEKTYREVMAPSDKHDDRWIASVASYIRQDWGNIASVIRPEDVALVRNKTKNRYRAWNLKELSRYARPEIADRSQWKAKSSSGPSSAAKAINRKNDSCDNPNQPGRWFQLDLGGRHTLTSIELKSANPDRYPRNWELTFSDDEINWSSPIAKGRGDGDVTIISFEPTVARYFRVTQTGSDPHHRWSIVDVRVFGTPGLDSIDSVQPSLKPPTMEEILESRGDPQKGQTVFKKTCANCHLVEGTGISFGPDLTDVGARLKKREIIASIFDPDAVVDPKHRGELILTEDGKLLSGFVVRQSKDSLVLRTADNKVHEIRKSDIENRRQLKKSFMPSGFDRTMPRRDLVDLVEYISNLGKNKNAIDERRQSKDKKAIDKKSP